MISSKAKIEMSTIFSLSTDKNFMFKSINEANSTLFYHIVDLYINNIIIRNDSLNTVKISKTFCLKLVIKMIHDDCSNDVNRSI